MRHQTLRRWPNTVAVRLHHLRGARLSPLLVITGLLLSAAGALLGVVPGGTPVAAAAAPRLAINSTSPAGHVTVLVLDMSGSMGNPGTGGNDPQGLRCSAANAYIDLSGPGDFVGVVGLTNTTSARGGPHNFETADWSLQPSELSTVARRQQLRGAIQQQSGHCAGNGGTPTYDALAKAEAMLARATSGGAIPGSAILLTDGVPDPDTGAQVAAIKSDLIPQFKAHSWPIDTVALGQDSGGFHSFLGDIASATSGAFYDDGHGVVPGVSPLNIAPFFIDIFRLRNGRSPGPDIPPTTLSGGTTARNFDVGQYVSHLDIVVVKDSASTRVSLVAPNGQRFPPAAAGTFISTDPYYAIFAIDVPQTGTWELDVSGSGQFLMDSLKVSTLSLLLTSPAASAVLALGEPFTLSAQLSNQGTPISGGQFSLTGTISYASGVSGSPYTQDVVLTDTTGSGTYSAPVTVPTAAPTGSYQIVVKAHSASEDVLAVQMVVRMDLFPAALLISPTTGKVTSGTVQAQVIGWDALLRLVYRWPVLSWLGNLPLDGHPADPSAVVHGQVELSGAPYSQATVTATAVRAGGTTPIPVTVFDDGGGAFHLIFPAGSSGTYQVTLTTAGAYRIAHGDLTHVTRTLIVTIAPPTLAQRLRAYLWTLFYALVLLLLFFFVRYLRSPKPFGVLEGPDGPREFALARRMAPAKFFAPSSVRSEEMDLDPGVVFQFQRGQRILVRATSNRSGFELNGSRLTTRVEPASEGVLSDGGTAYTIHASGGRAEEDEEREGSNGQRAGLLARVRGPRLDDDRDDEDDGDRGRRRPLFAARRTGSSNWEDEDERGPRRQRRRYANDDDDDYVSQRRRGRSRRARDEDD